VVNKGGARRHTKKTGSKKLNVQRKTSEFERNAQAAIDAAAQNFQPKPK
jgi:hypothetical protein